MLDTLRNDALGEGALAATPFGPRRVTYADHIASGRALASVEERLRATVLPLYANTHTEDSATGAHTTRLVHEAAAYVKRCLGADEGYKLAFAGTGATGAIKRLQEILGISVCPTLRQRVLAGMAAEDRWVVFIGPYEHHSNELSWRESLAEVVTIGLDDSGLLDLGALERALTDERYAGRPRLGSFSAASNVTGLLTDVHGVARLLHRHGALAAFDFAASAPYVAIDVRPGEDDAIDALYLSPHKFMGGPGSPGLLLFHESLYRLPAPTTAGGGTVSYVSPTGHRFLSDIEAREDAGTPGILQKLRAAMAFRVKEQVGVETIEARERSFIARALARLGEHPDIELLGNLEAPRLAVVSFLVRAGGHYLHPRFVIRLLNDLFGVQGRAGCSCAGPYGHELLHIDGPTSLAYGMAVERGYEGVKPGWSRLSFHYAIDEEEFAFLLDAVLFVADYGARFLPLYRFDWSTGAWSHPDDPPTETGFAPEDWVEVRRSTRSAAEDHRDYLRHAKELAEGLEPYHDHDPATPEDVERSLVFFTADPPGA